MVGSLTVPSGSDGEIAQPVTFACNTVSLRCPHRADFHLRFKMSAMGTFQRMSLDNDPALHRGYDPKKLEQMRKVAIPVLVDAFTTGLERFDDALFDRAERAGGSQMMYLEAMRELRRRRVSVAGHFRDHLEKAWQALAAGTPLSVESAMVQPEQAAADGDLRLVSEDELESRLAVRNLAAVILRDYKPVLARLDRRLGWLAGGVELDADHNPIGPEHIGMAVHEGFALCELDSDVRLVLIKLCERDLAPGIGRAYESIDQHLVRAGVLADAPPPARPEPAQAAPRREQDDTPPAWAARFLNRMSHTRGYMQSEAADPFRGGFDAQPDPQAGLFEALQHFMQESRGPRASAQATNPEARPLSQREMLSVLSLLQTAPSATLRAAISDSEESLAQRLKNEVLASATRMGMDPAAAQLSPGDEDAIDLVGMLFDVMLDERDLEGRPRELIGRLAVPFVKVAMLDRQMFVQKTHPARRLLNVLAEACEGNEGDTPAERTLMSKVEDIVDRLVAEFNENLAIFRTLEEEFREFLVQHKRKVEIAERRAAEIQRGQERLETARTRAEAELASRLQGRALPQAIEDFMRQPWAHHVTMAVLREGEDGESLAEALVLADGVLAELDEANLHIAGKPWLQAWRPALQKVFASVGMNPDAASGAIDALHDTLQAVAQARPDLEKPLPELPPVSLPKLAEDEHPAVDLVGDSDTLDFDPTDADHFRALSIGTWLDFIDKDNKVQPGKLSWVSPISSRLLFVNRRGVRFCVASPEELAAMVRMGRLRRHEDTDAFDAAMEGVIQKLDSEKVHSPQP